MTTIHYQYTTESLAGLDSVDFETALHAELSRLYPGADISIESGGYGSTLGDVDASDLRSVANQVFDELCR